MPHTRCSGAPGMKLFAILLLALVSLIAAENVDDSELTTLNLGGVENEIVATSEALVSTAYDSKGITTTPSTKNIPTEENKMTKGVSTVQTTATKGISTTSTSSPVKFLNNKQHPSFVDLDKEAAIKEHKERFEYDYASLRKWGLIAAAILFVLGILILTCGKHGKLLRCRRKKRARNYDVTPA
ncbi:FXYD domain-containing ion transport regulator 5-like [Eublepharis macularius]|uniref:FXYD domain-containing ion transport regulator n=1 Tax=Eublepharis macularius TaxID=481883 RepID=A0AA97KGR5_EUBMA|nr:FXYD domain-containing ion transport regulator 5-like [Eublepharis macularius]